ncbi:MAG: ParB N-terminal domain-containing protein [Oscillospiraceae bacterium]|nr:ParB N-terminal domain-containing protein [Oscillospiraceae bacterium]
MKSLFSSTEPSKNTIIGKKRSSEQTTLPTDVLIPFPDQPFELYSGERKANMLDSIREYGILNPILVRELDTGEYQILSGHNRWTCARELDFAEVPVIILRDITDDEALMLVLDSNIQQRGISDMPISKQARIYAMDVAVNKRQGKRSDIINEIESNLKILNNGTADTLYQGGTKLDTISDVGNKYGVSRMTITRFIRIDMLCNSLKVHIDTERIGVLAGVQLSYLSTVEQEFTADALDENKYKLSESKAKQMRTLSANNALTDNVIIQILEGSYNKKVKSDDNIKPCPFCGAILSAYREVMIVHSVQSEDYSNMRLEHGRFLGSDKYFAVHCIKCGAIGQRAPEKELAKKLWNARGCKEHERLMPIKMED